jgi:hypothetical protein
MLAAHGVAVLLTAALLARGDRMLSLLLVWLRSLPFGVRAPAAPPPVDGGAVGRAAAAAAVAARPVHDVPAQRACAPVVRRGPPCRAC